MSLLADYTCGACRSRFEAWVSSPPPATHRCIACGSTAARSWSPVGLLRGAKPTVERSPKHRAEGPLCATNPDVPGLCCMSADAGRMWLARARKDNRAIERELERQQARPADSKPTPLTHNDKQHLRRPEVVRAPSDSA